MSRKSKLAVCGIVLFFWMVVAGTGYASSLATRALDGAGVPDSHANAPAFQNPSQPPLTATSTSRFIIVTFDIPITLVPEISAIPVITEIPISQTPFPTNIPTDNPTPTDTPRFLEITLPPAPAATTWFRPRDIPTDTPDPSLLSLPTDTEQAQQPAAETAVPSPAEPLPLESVTLSVTPAETLALEQTPTTAGSQTALPAAVGPESTMQAPGDANALPFTILQLQIAGIAAFVIIDAVILAVIFRNWNKTGRRAK